MQISSKQNPTMHLHSVYFCLMTTASGIMILSFLILFENFTSEFFLNTSVSYSSALFWRRQTCNVQTLHRWSKISLRRSNSFPTLTTKSPSTDLRPVKTVHTHTKRKQVDFMGFLVVHKNSKLRQAVQRPVPQYDTVTWCLRVNNSS